ncbi:adenylate kinase 7 [Brachyhypopomus gauderio]|uniref:adenylate kinase 7 n=1 Tax=Brachyhypopomus gauderio TaxID=698409 RepID=UPI0040432C1D
MAEAPTTVKRPSKRVFINNVDSYASKHIAKFLASCVAGASLAQETDEEGGRQDAQKRYGEGALQVVGTTTKPEDKPSCIAEEYNNLKREELFHHLMESDVIIYNITEHTDQIEEASWAVSALHKEMDVFAGSKMFILISTVMTWAMSKPVDPDDPEIPFMEEDYRRRKPHPNFKEHIAVEKLVVKLGKNNQRLFSTYVIASGLQYGMGEHVFHFFFKTAWLGEVPRVPVFGEGSNSIPVIHINDLAGIVQNVIDHKPKQQYFLAVDDSKNTINDIVRAIALVLGPGKTQEVPKEDVYLIKELTQAHIDCLFINLRMETVFLKENFNISWVSEAGIVENIEQVTEEYKLTRGLLPLRICVLGPPAVGKSTVAEKICKHYKLHHVKLKDTITETLAYLESFGHTGDDESENGESPSAGFLETLKHNMEQNKGCLDEQYIIQLMKDKLMSKPCVNQGFVLDGFPKTYEQAGELFSADDDGPDDARTPFPPHNKRIVPEFVFALDATDVFLTERVLNLPESVVQETSFSYEKFPQRLARFRECNLEDVTVLNYFDELELHPRHIEITALDDPDYMLVMEKVTEAVGEPRNYGPSVEEAQEEERRRVERQLRLEEARRAEVELREAEEAAERARRWKAWSQQLEEIKKQEEELLQAQSKPLQHYLTDTVVPTLTQGLIDCCKARPSDPVDFLAEYLFKNNPQV